MSRWRWRLYVSGTKHTDMVSDVVASGVVAIIAGAAGYAIAGWVNLKSTTKQIEAQEKRLDTRIEAENRQRRADYYIEQKVNGLMQLYSAMKQVRREYKRKADVSSYQGITKEEYEELIATFDEYESAMDRGAIFLDDEQQEKLLDVLHVLMAANGHFSDAMDNLEYVEQYDFGEYGLSDFNDRFNAAEEMLQEEMKGPIDHLDDE